MAYCPVDGDPAPKSRGPQETPDKPKPTESGGAAGRIKCGASRLAAGAPAFADGRAVWRHAERPQLAL